MNCRMAPGRPTRPLLHEQRMWHFADVDLPTSDALALDLRVAFQAQIRIAFDEHLAIDRSVWVMTHSAAFAHRFVLEHKRPCLFAMTLCAGLIQTRHRQAPCPFENVAAMRIMALHAVHTIFEHRMVLRQIEFGVRLQMALEACFWRFTGVDDELAASAASRHVKAAGAMTGLAAGAPGRRTLFKVDSCVRAGREGANVIRMAVVTGTVTHKRCSGDFRSGDTRSRQ